MKNISSYLMVAAVLLAGVVSCRKVEISSEDARTGYLGFDIIGDGSEQPVSKAAAGADTENLIFRVKVYNSSDALVEEIPDHRTATVDQPIEVKMGNYTVVATDCEFGNAAFDADLYGAQKGIYVKPEQLNTISLTAKLMNTRLSVEFPDTFASEFDSYSVSVTNGVGDPLVLTNNPEDGNALESGFSSYASFAVTGTLSWTLRTVNKDGVEYTTSRTYTSVKAGEHYKLKFSIGDPEEIDGAFILKVLVDEQMTQVNHDNTLDFDNRDLPGYSTNAEFDLQEGMTIPIGNAVTKRISFTAPAGIRSFIISHYSDILTAMEIPSATELVGATDGTVSALAAKGIVTTAVGSGSQQASVDVTQFVKGLGMGSYEMFFTVVDTKGHFSKAEFCFEVVSDVDAEAVSAKAWAKFAFVEGKFFSIPAPDGLAIMYKVSGDSQWNTVPAGKMTVNTSTMKVNARIDGLTPSTGYVFKVVTTKDTDTKEIHFTTEAAATVPNLNFDTWNNDSGYWMPNASDQYIWDTANPGTSGLGIIPTVPEESDVVSGKAARLESKSAMGMLAAGNIYIGKFGNIKGLGAELDWGTEFNGRPLALRGYMKYAPVPISIAKAPYANLKDQTDICRVQILITDWSKKFHVNTSSSTFVDFDNDPNIIAYGEFCANETHQNYIRFTIPLEYRTLDRIPNYIVIVGAASRYGDYFTGGVGSVLKLDEFELIYDPAELTDAEFAKTNIK